MSLFCGGSRKKTIRLNEVYMKRANLTPVDFSPPKISNRRPLHEAVISQDLKKVKVFYYFIIIIKKNNVN